MASDAERLTRLETQQRQVMDDIHCMKADLKEINKRLEEQATQLTARLEEMARPKWGTWLTAAGVFVAVFLAWDASESQVDSKVESSIARIDGTLSSLNRWMGGVETTLDQLKSRQIRYDSLENRIYSLEQRIPK